MIPQDTQVKLRLMEGLSTATDHKGYVVQLEVASDVVADGVVVAPAGMRTTVKITHAGSMIQFSDPKLMAGGCDLRLSEHTAAERGELGAEEGAAIGMAIVDAPLVAIQLPISAVWAAVHAARSNNKKIPKDYVTMEKGETFLYYVRNSTRAKVDARCSQFGDRLRPHMALSCH
ncbi:MAG TPA: hypothetical protein VG267_11000 [Terracidiphilus sp.]|nr:hypothetical protein [Terracidiphilus sp.]